MKVLEDCVTNKSLVLIDELFKHTTFDEGLALALAFLENLAELKACFYRYFYNIWTLYFIFKADFVNFIFPIFRHSLLWLLIIMTSVSFQMSCRISEST